MVAVAVVHAIMDRLGDLTRVAIAILFAAVIARAFIQGDMSTDAFMGIAGAAVGYWYGARSGGTPQPAANATAPPAPTPGVP